jgi:hypothetical protein
MNYTKIVSSNPLKQWQHIIAEDLKVYTKNPIYVIARFKVYPLRIISQNYTGNNDKLIAYLIESDNVQGRIRVFMTFTDDVNMVTEYSIRRSGYFCKELSELLVLSLLQRIRKGGKHNVSAMLLPNKKKT